MTGDRRIDRHVLGVALVALAAASIYMSWGALYEFALACGFPPERAVMFPVVIDVVTVVAMLIALRIESESKITAFYPWGALLVFGAATVAGNAMHVTTIPADQLSVPVPVAVIASAMPAVASMVTTHLAAVTVYRRAAAAAAPAVDVAAEAPVAAPTRDEARGQVLTLASRGATLREIERETGVSRSTASRWIKAPADELVSA